MGQLDGRVALVTGGGRGIGRGISELLAAEGAAIAVNYRRDADAAASTVAAIRAAGGVASAFHASVDDADACAVMTDAVAAEFGGLDILVCNAGIASRGNAVADTDPAEMMRVVAAHAFGPHHLARLAMPHLRSRGRGDIVMISSIATTNYSANGAPYNMGKAAMEALAFTLAKEERGNGIHVNVVAPGLVETDMGVRLARSFTGNRSLEDLRTLDAVSPFAGCANPSMSPTSCSGCAARERRTSPDNASNATAAVFDHGGSLAAVSPLAAEAAQTEVGQIITVTPEALQELVKLRDTEPEGDRLGLRLEIVSNPGEDFKYDLSFDIVTKAAFSDEVRTHSLPAIGSMKVIIAASAIDLLEGATLDHTATQGLVLRNPNKPKAPSVDGLTSNDALSAEVEALIKTEVNPALAAHGGFVSYVGHDGEGTAYLTMGGGCHGCSMSRMTMLDGVQTMLVEQIPEIERVRDLTDHASGENPYYH